MEIWVFVGSSIGLWVDQKYSRIAEFIGDPNKGWSLRIYNGKISVLLYENRMQQLDDQGQSWKKIVRFKEGEILQYVHDKNAERQERYIYSKHILEKSIMKSIKLNRKGNEGGISWICRKQQVQATGNPD